ncbi:hypothetical protein [Sphingobacterium mizutaii]|uniref:hypothetical protein n=1 Tax=Sphingobacterium mizutaii TaxID=1010 RepID=UPI0011BE6962|nr:hypothetical protein [Sphingobacterium mizutaii]
MGFDGYRAKPRCRSTIRYLNQDGWDGRMDQDLGLNQDGMDKRMDQDYDMKLASLTIIDPNSVGAYCISPHPILNI